MALLTSVNRFAQEEIMRGMLKIHTEHDEKSRTHLFRILSKLNKRDDMDIVITYYDDRSVQPEFGLAWFSKDDSVQHPMIFPQNALFIGGLVFDPYSNSWGAHT